MAVGNEVWLFAINHHEIRFVMKKYAYDDNESDQNSETSKR